MIETPYRNFTLQELLRKFSGKICQSYFDANRQVSKDNFKESAGFTHWWKTTLAVLCFKTISSLPASFTTHREHQNLANKYCRGRIVLCGSLQTVQTEGGVLADEARVRPFVSVDQDQGSPGVQCRLWQNHETGKSLCSLIRFSRKSDSRISNVRLSFCLLPKR